MNPNTTVSPATPPFPEVSTLALSLAQAERAIHAFTAGQVDAVFDAEGQGYLLRPAQAQLQAEVRRLRAILDHSPDGLMVLDRAGLIVAQHGSALNGEELLGRRIFALVHEEDLTRLYTGFFNVAEGLQPVAIMQFRLPERGGGWRIFEATAARGHGSEARQVILNLRPLLARRPMLEEASRLRVPSVTPARDRFLSMLSHELRTPLAPILMGVEELEADERFAAAAPALAMIHRNIEHQKRLLDELMEFTLVSEHKVRLRLERLDLHAHIGYVLDTCRSELAAAQITIVVNFGDCSPGTIICADSLRLQQVMWNLAKNAIKFSPPGGNVLIATSDRPPGHVTIDFTDQGIGIEPELLGLVFDAYQQGSGAQQRNQGGLGLGLFIAKGLAEAQAGQLTVHSEGSGLGSTFRLIMPKPRADGSTPPATPPPSSAPPPQGGS